MVLEQRQRAGADRDDAYHYNVSYYRESDAR